MRTHKAHKYENKWREGWTERTLLFILVDGRVIPRLESVPIRTFCRKFTALLRCSTFEIDWVPADIGRTQKSKGYFLPFLSLLVMKDFSIGIGLGALYRWMGNLRHGAAAGARHANADGSAQRLSLRAQVTKGGRVDCFGRRQTQHNSFVLRDVKDDLVLRDLFLVIDYFRPSFPFSC